MTNLFDFVWPTIAALQSMRREVDWLRPIDKNIANDLLRRRYAIPFNVKRANLVDGWIGRSWGEQEHMFAITVLINIFAIYEGWISDFVLKLDGRNATRLGGAKKFSDAVQFHYRNNKHEDWDWALSKIAAHASADLDACYGKRLRSHQAWSLSKSKELLICYRYFKEIRNSYIHGNGLATRQLIDAQNDYKAVIDAKAFGSKTVPQITNESISVGQRIDLSLYTVSGFNDVVLRLMVTLDAEAGLTTFGEEVVSSYFKSIALKKSRSGKRVDTIRGMSHLYGPENFPAFERIMARNGVVIP